MTDVELATLIKTTVDYLMGEYFKTMKYSHHKVGEVMGISDDNRLCMVEVHEGNLLRDVHVGNGIAVGYGDEVVVSVSNSSSTPPVVITNLSQPAMTNMAIDEWNNIFTVYSDQSDPNTVAYANTLTKHANCPTPDDEYYIVTYFEGDRSVFSNRMQTAVSKNLPSPTFHVRTYANNTWTPWVAK